MKNIIKIMPCLDVQNGRVVKGVQFADMRDAGDPAECARFYCGAGADEIAILDITATIENRAATIDTVKKIADAITVPLSVGGGIRDVASAEIIFKAGANKVSTSSAAFRNPQVIAEIIKEFGPEKVIVAVDAAVNELMPSGYEIYIDGGKTATGADAAEWIKKIDGYGVKTILPTSKTADGGKRGYDLSLIKSVRETVSKNVDVIASGGAGTLEHFKEAVEAGASILLAASVFHFKMIGIGKLKAYLRDNGVNVMP